MSASSVFERLRRGRVSARTFRRLSLLALGALFVVMVSGAVVRLTASGLGCENWPRCGDTPFPELEFHAAIEFGNRVIALIGIVLATVTAIAARRVEGLRRSVRWCALGVALGTITQIPLGGITVIVDLHPLAVMSHFLLALGVLGLSVLVALEARRFEVGRGSSSVPRPLAWLALALLPVGLAVIVTGAFVTAAGPHSGGEDIRRLGNLQDAIYVHVRATAVFGIAFLVTLLALAWLRRQARTELVIAGAALVLLLIQMGVGEYQWRNRLPWGIVLLHVALGAAIWASLVALAVRLVWASSRSGAKELQRRALPVTRLP
jgi:cytochrome c oxidase assembly protein subunit 15